LTDARQPWASHTFRPGQKKSYRKKSLNSRDENSAVVSSKLCDPNVKQYSGYLDKSGDENIFFWFFESRKDQDSVPITIWLNGGPGCSSMIGLFQELGPCRSINNGTSVEPNSHSWNEVSHLLFIDQPFGVGFSYGDTTKINSTEHASSNLYTFLQRFFDRFPEYANLDLHLFGESFGGRYVPTIARIIYNKNKEIIAGKNDDTIINLKSIGIGNGWIHPIIQYPAYANFACDMDLRKCVETRKPADCSAADNFCLHHIYDVFYNTSGLNNYDMRVSNLTLYPPSDYQGYLNQSHVIKQIGARKSYEECSNSVFDSFAINGENALSSAEDI
ncbi:5227_t:CDS:2, partial [Ambispora gerdemannii]